jgi:hypothetical protein
VNTTIRQRNNKGSNSPSSKAAAAVIIISNERSECEWYQNDKQPEECAMSPESWADMAWATMNCYAVHTARVWDQAIRRPLIPIVFPVLAGVIIRQRLGPGIEDTLVIAVLNVIEFTNGMDRLNQLNEHGDHEFAYHSKSTFAHGQLFTTRAAALGWFPTTQVVFRIRR